MTSELVEFMTYSQAALCLIAIFVAVMNLLESVGKLLVPESSIPEPPFPANDAWTLARWLRASDMLRDTFFLGLVLTDLVVAVLGIALLDPLVGREISVRVALRCMEILNTAGPLGYMLLSRYVRQVMLQLVPAGTSERFPPESPDHGQAGPSGTVVP